MIEPIDGQHVQHTGKHALEILNRKFHATRAPTDSLKEPDHLGAA